MEIQDQLQRFIYFAETPKRIISLVPSQTELLCDLGLKGNLVGVTKFCVHPNGIRKEVPVVGGTKQIHLDKIKALQPDIILCNKEENTKAIVEFCEAICNVHISDIFTVNDSLKLITQYGSIFKKERAALNLVNKIEKEVETFEGFIHKKPVLKVAYFIWRKPWMAVANHTFINYILSLNKLENIYLNKSRYPEIDLKDIKAHEQAEIVCLSSEPYPFKEIHRHEVQEYYPNAKVVLVDGEMFSWYGSRLIKAFNYFKQLRLSLQSNQSC